MSGDDVYQEKSKLWGELASQQHSLFDDILKRNRELDEQVKELKRDANAWKIAYTTTTQQMEKLQKDSETLSRSLAEMKDRDSIALALIDGDGCIFTSQYWKQGKEGGRLAAAVLHQTLSAEAGRLPYLHTVIYFNRKGLADTLCANGVCSRAEFEDFVIGFNQSAHLFTMVDVGQRKEAADAKIREMLRLFAHLPQTKLILFGGGHDNGYATDLSALRTERLLDKVVLLKGYTQLAREVESLEVPTKTVEGLFFEHKLPYSGAWKKEYPGQDVERATSPTPSMPFGGTWKKEFLSHVPDRASSPTPPPVSNLQTKSDNIYIMPANADPRRGRPIDFTKPLMYQTVKLCKAYYLVSSGCQYGARCKFAHDYELNTSLVAKFRNEVASITCADFRNGGCNSKDCIYGHERFALDNSDVADGYRRNSTSLPPEELPLSGRLTPPEGIPIGPSIGLAHRERSSSVAGIGGGTPVIDSHSPPTVEDIERSDSPEAPSDVGSATGTTKSLVFSPLLKALNDLKSSGSVAPFCSNVGEKLSKMAPDVYRSAGVGSFKEYAQWAEREGLVCLIPVGPGVDRISLASGTSFV
ncbi:uncharacterized protein EI90DRAFT_2992437 [Cantharellus anzutake]|uniref:uncharacterized protein n=1 Tax=Cantharellus anzutake TaxID=1750568 RepID=UPI001904586B|nr:uncharacterized protein EI90DRAFT_2992437 [Cantharellus anzutake]KAF8336368.1 hypothetical protein EI90DRAFT_2992437 [Cantharellus anzutake]